MIYLSRCGLVISGILDTGAAFTGRLSALNIDSKEFWQSDVLQELYPHEKGEE